MDIEPNDTLLLVLSGDYLSFYPNITPDLFLFETGEVKAWLNVKGFEKFMGWLFSKFDPDIKKMMAMEPTPLEIFKTKVEDEYVWVGINQDY